VTDCYPKWSIIHFEFPARDALPPVHLTWYDGGKLPPSSLETDEKLPSSGCILLGSEGTLFAPDDYGAEAIIIRKGAKHALKGSPETLPRSPGHHDEWVAACKGGPAAMCNFKHATVFTEAMLLGDVAIRAGKRIEWDAAAGQVTNGPEANQFVRREYRKGWTL
jgi:hypothetical protein